MHTTPASITHEEYLFAINRTPKFRPRINRRSHLASHPLWRRDNEGSMIDTHPSHGFVPPVHLSRLGPAQKSDSHNENSLDVAQRSVPDCHVEEVVSEPNLTSPFVSDVDETATVKTVRFADDPNPFPPIDDEDRELLELAGIDEPDTVTENKRQLPTSPSSGESEESDESDIELPRKSPSKRSRSQPGPTKRRKVPVRQLTLVPNDLVDEHVKVSGIDTYSFQLTCNRQALLPARMKSLLRNLKPKVLVNALERLK